MKTHSDTLQGARSSTHVHLCTKRALSQVGLWQRISTAAAGALWLFPSFYVTVQPLLHCQIAAHQQPSSLQSSCSINGATKAGSPQSSTNLQQF
ncbi:hypothetical protein HYQ46_001001 [Verticillium longisporum]|nr:hypothetical protein HYQ46_001001 [Verticillium longisporum]